jgi:MoxR-like ATPase
MTSPNLDIARTSQRLHDVARFLESRFLDKQEIIQLLIISVVAGEHALIVGPPGTAKSAMIRTFAELIDSKYFEYLLTRFTEPNELFGPVDIKAFREGHYQRRTHGMLPESEIVFLDEIFKSNSAILNSLLMMINERRFTNGPTVTKVPLISVFAASNEVPNDESLSAVFDRFMIRVRSDNLDSYHFHELLNRGRAYEESKAKGESASTKPLLSSNELREIQSQLQSSIHLSDDFLSKYKGLIFQIRSEGISVSDRRAVKCLKLFAASALLNGRSEAVDGDFFVLKHVWNNLEQSEILSELINPVVDGYFREHPQEGQFLGPSASLDDLLAELNLVRELLTKGETLSDVQLFSQLKNLNDIKAALDLHHNETAKRMSAQVDGLLETVFASSKFGG